MSVVKRGDTVIEVIIAITIFCLVAVISVTLMNNGISTAQGSLETTMARNEIDAQAEALRFIQNSFLAERELETSQQQYAALWRRITRGQDSCDFTTGGCGLAISAEEYKKVPLDLETCDVVYGNESSAISIYNHAFVLNTRALTPIVSGTGSNVDALDEAIVPAVQYPERFIAAPVYPRLVFTNRISGMNGANSGDELVEDQGSTLYNKVARAEGIWIIAVRSDATDAKSGNPEFFDFYIRTCWYGPGKSFPSTIGTIVRLYNPEVIE